MAQLARIKGKESLIRSSMKTWHLRHMDQLLIVEDSLINHKEGTIILNLRRLNIPNTNRALRSSSSGRIGIVAQIMQHQLVATLLTILDRSLK